MLVPYKTDEGLADLLAAIERQGGVLEPEQERELLGYEARHVINAIRSAEFKAQWFEEMEKFIRTHRKQAEQEADMLRPKAREILGEPGAKASDPDGLWKASVVNGRESVKLLGPIEEVPPIFVKERVEVSVNHDLARTQLEAGQEILSTVTGLPILKLERTPSVRIVLTEAGKVAEIQARVGTVMGLPAPAAAPVLQLVKEK